MENKALHDIEAILLLSGSSLSDFIVPLPSEEPEDDTSFESGPDMMSLLLEAEEIYNKINADQRNVYEIIIEFIDNSLEVESICFFDDGPSSSEKAFQYKAVISYHRASQKKMHRDCLQWYCGFAVTWR